MPPEGTVYIVDDDSAVRQSVRFLLTSVRLQSETFASANEFLAKLEGGIPEAGACVVLDVRMPGMSGLELQEKLARRGSPMPVILVTGHGDVPMAVRAMKAGAYGFLTKPYQDQELLDLVNGALAHEASQRDAAEHRRLARERAGRLTQREVEVMALVVDGLANKQIAASLGVAEKTVESHRASIMRKMEADSLAQLVRMSIAAAE
ncbi:MAG: response regulator transcription factor [Phycisphaerales bacterium]